MSTKEKNHQEKNHLILRRWNNLWGDQVIIQVVYVDDKGEHIRGSFTLFENELDLLSKIEIEKGEEENEK